MSSARAHSLSTISPDDWPDMMAAERKFYFKDAPGEGALTLLRSMSAFPDHGYPINVFRHSLQTATRCFASRADEELIVVALLHDVGEALTYIDHGAVAAALLKPFISEANVWLLEQHPIFQEHHYAANIGRDPHRREKLRGHPHFAHTARFCELYDQSSFDPEFDEMPLAAFEPMVRRLFSRPRA